MTVDTPVEPGVLPITEQQQGLLVIDGWVPTPQIYNQLMQVDLDPALPSEVVAPALAALVGLQPALRQVFARLPEAYATLTPPPAPDELPLEQVVVEPGGYRAAVDAAARRLGGLRFDLATGPAYRLAHIRASDGSASAIVFCAHHIVGDGVSMGPLIRDLGAALTGELGEAEIRAKSARREEALLQELRTQIRISGSADTTERARSWAERLREVPPLVLSPRPNRPAETDFSGARIAWTLSETETADLYRTCKRLGITPFVLLTAVYGTVLARHGGVSSVLVGSPFTARRRVASFDLCGFFVNTLPVTVEVDWTRTVDEHLGEVVRAAVGHCRANVDVSFNQLVAEVKQDRAGNRNPLFSCMLAMQDTFDDKPGGAIAGIREPGNDTAKFDLWLGATLIEGRWLLELEYDRTLLSAAVADGVLGSLRTALRRALADGSRTLADLFIDASAAVSLCTDGLGIESDAPTLAAWLADTARRTPGAVAIEAPQGQVTYAELASRAEDLADGLATRGVRAGDVVGLALDTLPDTVVAILATLHCGATYLPLDPSLPAERLASMVRRAGCAVVLGGAIDLPSDEPVTVAEVTAAADGSSRPRGGDPQTAAYLMFTSGSSGLPKGVLMGNAPLLDLASWQHAALGHDERTRFLQYAPLGFDVSFQEILPTLIAGGTVVSRDPVDRRDFPALARHIADKAVTHAFLPVAALRPFTQAASAGGVDLPALRYLCVSGEQLLVDDGIRAFFRAHPRCVLVNLYGPTETNAATTSRLTAGDEEWPAHVPIGVPLRGVAAYVVDDSGHLAPVGVQGELYLGGGCPADGYLGDTERTAASFLPDRFDGTPGARMYRTGDLVVRDERGILTFLGRRDNQVKVRGYRVELGEIEAVATAVPGVRQAVAVARGAGADRELVLLLLPDLASATDHEDLRRRLTATLPSHMVPAWFFDVDDLQTSGTGKIDRVALAELAEKLVLERKVSPAAPPSAYADELESEMAGLWAKVLDVDGIERDRSLLEYGAHSLNVFAAFAEIDQHYGTTITMSDFFRRPTVAALAELVRADAGESR